MNGKVLSDTILIFTWTLPKVLAGVLEQGRRSVPTEVETAYIRQSRTNLLWCVQILLAKLVRGRLRTGILGKRDRMTLIRKLSPVFEMLEKDCLSPDNDERSSQGGSETALPRQRLVGKTSLLPPDDT